MIFSFLAVLLVATGIEGHGLRRLEEPMPTTSATLSKIKERGKLKCGSTDTVGFSKLQEDGSYKGFEVDLCHAIAAAIFGDSDPKYYKTVPSSSATRFKDLASKKFDVLIQTTTHTLARDVNEPGAGVGFTFTVPYFYDGLKYAGPKGDCADTLDWESDECSDLKVCVNEFTTWYPRTQELFPPDVLVPVPSDDAMYAGLEAGDCNAFSGEGVYVLLSTAVENGYTGGDMMMEVGGDMDPAEVSRSAPGWHIGANTYSKEPLAMVTREDDPQFSDFVNWVLQGLMTAEEQGITAADFAEAAPDDTPMKLYSGFGDEYETMFKMSVATVGNYGEIYERHLQEIMPRSGLNMLNTDNVAQQYPHPM